MGNESSLQLLQERHEQFKALSPTAQRRVIETLEAREKAKAKVKRVRSDGTNMLVILRAARNLPETFHLEDLAIACWQLDPERFGMRRYNHPDVHRLRPCLDGEKGLVRRGMLESVGNNLLRLGPLAAKRTEDPMPRG